MSDPITQNCKHYKISIPTTEMMCPSLTRRTIKICSLEAKVWETFYTHHYKSFPLNALPIMLRIQFHLNKLLILKRTAGRNHHMVSSFPRKTKLLPTEPLTKSIFKILMISLYIYIEDY